MGKVKSDLVGEWFDHEQDDIEQAAAESFITHGRPVAAPYKGRSLSAIVNRLKWTNVQQRFWRKRHGL